MYLSSRSYLVDTWETKLFHEMQAKRLAHEERLTSVELLAMYNRPQSVVDLNKLRDNVYRVLGVKK